MMSHLNIGSGKDIAILDLARLIAKVVGFEGVIETDDNKPDGPSKKLLDISKVTDLGWAPSIEFEEGLRMTYKEYCKLH
jgi:nucleoside-diphosphate-sugar epimerase